jgi:adenylylsulfate kinase-like enzyme
MGVVIITRGVPGSGKSTLNRYLEELAEARGVSFSVHGGDKYMVNQAGEYEFSDEKKAYCAMRTHAEFNEALAKGTDVIVSDNTNIKWPDYKRNVREAQKAGYKLIAVVFEPGSIETHMERNTHDVPRETLEKNIADLTRNIKSREMDEEHTVEQQSVFTFSERLKNLASHLVPTRIKSSDYKGV